MQVASHKVVSIHYTLKSNDGTLIDRSGEAGPLAYLHGSGNIVPGLERALEGTAAGDEVSVEIAPDEAYGDREEQLVQQVPRDLFADVNEVRPGMQFQARTDAGTQRVVTVVEVGDEAVMIDGNHPLAGMTLCFDVQVVDVRDATAEEIEHGHVHDEG